MIRYNIFNCNWVATRWQQYSTHLHTNNTQKNTIDTKQYIEQHSSLIWKSADRAPSLRGISWHLPYNRGKSTEKPQSGWSENAGWHVENRIYRTEHTKIRIHKNDNKNT